MVCTVFELYMGKKSREADHKAKTEEQSKQVDQKKHS